MATHEGNRGRLDFREGISPNAKIILVDQDGVLADFEGEFLRRWRERHPAFPFIPHEERTRFYLADDYSSDLRSEIETIYSEKGFVENLPVIPGSLEALRQMRQDGHIVKVVTKPLTSNKDCVVEKRDWVERHLGTDWGKDIIFSYDKTLVYGDFLIDDNPDIVGALNPAWEHIVFDAPYNRRVTDRRRISGWSRWQEILEVVEK